ncbi:sugar ABC transporter ATP-binding protein [Leucobacter sp. L43]|uniref:sugar ABC transporter ATP-binding protein n=1 Tax=Leucobacter sp. L43 TaxID=2798040 RepID=UPI0019049D8E|nr:sugar ABC transporter ATP-binding protein [Leucobacter sp. L43]
MSLIEIEGVSVIFPGVKALDNVGFTVDEGEVIALCGENGAGKSTVGKVLSGVISVSDYVGTVRMNGEVLRSTNTIDAAEQGIVIVHQELNLFPELSVGENIFIDQLPGRAGVIDAALLRKRSVEILDLLGVDIDPDEKVKNLAVSGQQLVEIAKALARDPKVIVFDEATSSLSKPEVAALFAIIRRLRARGIAILYVSHKLDEIFEICTRVIVLKDGQFVRSSPVGETNHDEVVSWMVGRAVSDLYPSRSSALALTDTPALEVRGWTVPNGVAGQRNLVDDVSFSLGRGEILGVYGLVGAGRTELLRSIFEGRASAVRGQLFLNGVETTLRDPRDAIQQGLALVTEDRKHDGLVFTMNVRENLTLAAHRLVSSRAGVIRRSDERTLAQDISDRLKVKVPGIQYGVKKLSGGNQQKVILGKWLLTRPQVLILDEPTRGIDIGAKSEIYRIMHELSAAGVSIIMISSELPEILGISDRILVLREGHLQGSIDRSEANEERLAHIAMTGATA